MKQTLLFLFFVGCIFSNASEKDVKALNNEAQISAWKAFISKALSTDFALKKDDVIKQLGEPDAIWNNPLLQYEVKYIYKGDSPLPYSVSSTVLLLFGYNDKNLLGVTLGGVDGLYKGKEAEVEISAKYDPKLELFTFKIHNLHKSKSISYVSFDFSKDEDIKIDSTITPFIFTLKSKNIVLDGRHSNLEQLKGWNFLPISKDIPSGKQEQITLKLKDLHFKEGKGLKDVNLVPNTNYSVVCSLNIRFESGGYMKIESKPFQVNLSKEQNTSK